MKSGEPSLETAWDLLTSPKYKKQRIVAAGGASKTFYRKLFPVKWSDPILDSFLSSSICLCSLRHDSQEINDDLGCPDTEICERCHSRRREFSVLRPGTITEISGVAGAGKSQICMQLCVGSVIDCHNEGGGSNNVINGLVNPHSTAASKLHHSHHPGPSTNKDEPRRVKNPYSKTPRRSLISSSQRDLSCDDALLANLPNNSLGSSIGVGNTFSTQLHAQAKEAMDSNDDNYSPNSHPGNNFKDVLYVRMGSDAVSSASASGGASMHAARMGQLAAARVGVDAVNGVLSHVHTLDIRNVDDFSDLIYKTLPSMMLSTEYDISLIIFDSIAGLFRDDFDYAVTTESKRQNVTQIGKNTGNHDQHESVRLVEASARSGKLFAATAQIKRLSQHHGVPVVIVNQVTADINRINGAGTIGVDGVVPALGLSWSNCINSRIMLSRRDGQHELCTNSHESLAMSDKQVGSILTPNNSAKKQPSVNLSNTKFHRELHVIFSPFLPPKTLTIKIDASGVHGISQ